MNIQDVKINSTIEFDGKLWYVVEYQKVSRPRLAALFRTKLKNIETGQVLEKNFLPHEVVGEVFVDTKEMQYSYDDGDLYHFMDTETWDETLISHDMVGDNFKFVKEEMMCKISSFKGKVFSVEPPTFVELAVVATEPGVRGDTATNVTKPATLETGAVVKVPIFINEGDVLRIDTRTGEYLERA